MTMLAAFVVMLCVGWALGWLHAWSAAAEIRCPKCYFRWRPNSAIIEISDRQEPPAC